MAKNGWIIFKLNCKLTNYMLQNVLQSTCYEMCYKRTNVGFKICKKLNLSPNLIWIWAAS